MEKRDIMNFVSSVELVTGISQKTGNDYSFINIKFVNGYETAVFPRSNDAMYIIKNIIVKD